MRNLISISGKIGMGKDTVCSIIQYLTTKKQSNIDCSFEEFRGSTLEMLSPYQNKKMAGKLKQVASILTGIPVNKFEDQEFKKTILGSEWNYEWNIDWENDWYPVAVGKGNRKKEEFGGGINKMTIREFLQKLGTDAIRNGLHEDTWLNAFWIDYKPIGGKMISPNYPKDYTSGRFEFPNWIITDCRFENEYNSVKERGGLMIKVERPSSGTDNHASETGLDSITDWDYVIQNDGTINDLIEKVKAILIKERII
jgi:hypothetical protein